MKNYLYLISFCSLLFIASSQTSYLDYDLTYDDSDSCMNICTRDTQICTTWVNPITGYNESTNCQDAVTTYCTDVCPTTPLDVVSCTRCDNYKFALCPSSPNGQKLCDTAFSGCYDDCICMENNCRDDYVFCIKYLNEWLGAYQCQMIISSSCYIPCREGNTLTSPVRQQGYMQYCYDTALHYVTDCSQLIWPEYVPA